MKIKMTSGYDVVAQGGYKATFLGIEEKILPSHYSESGQENNYVWMFQLTDGREVVGFSSAEKPATPKNKTGRYLAWIAGTSPTALADVETDVDAYIGRPYQVIVNERGKVEQFTLLDV